MFKELFHRVQMPAIMLRVSDMVKKRKRVHRKTKRCRINKGRCASKKSKISKVKKLIRLAKLKLRKKKR